MSNIFQYIGDFMREVGYEISDAVYARKSRLNFLVSEAETKAGKIADSAKQSRVENKEPADTDIFTSQIQIYLDALELQNQIHSLRNTFEARRLKLSDRISEVQVNTSNLVGLVYDFNLECSADKEKSELQISDPDTLFKLPERVGRISELFQGRYSRDIV